MSLELQKWADTDIVYFEEWPEYTAVVINARSSRIEASTLTSWGSMTLDYSEYLAEITIPPWNILVRSGSSTNVT